MKGSQSAKQIDLDQFWPDPPAAVNAGTLFDTPSAAGPNSCLTPLLASPMNCRRLAGCTAADAAATCRLVKLLDAGDEVAMVRLVEQCCWWWKWQGCSDRVLSAGEVAAVNEDSLALSISSFFRHLAGPQQLSWQRVVDVALGLKATPVQAIAELTALAEPGSKPVALQSSQH